MFEKPMKVTIWYLYRYAEIKKAIQNKREERGAAKKDMATISSGRIVDPTALQAINNIEPLKEVVLPDGKKIREPEKICIAIEHVYECSDVLAYRIAQRKYNKKQSWKQITVEEHISKSAMYEALKEFAYKTMILFVESGIVKIKTYEEEGINKKSLPN